MIKRKNLLCILMALTVVTVCWRLVLAPPQIAQANDRQNGPPLTLQYTLLLARPSTHLIGVEIQVGNVSEHSLSFVMPAWAPGRYAIYNFAKGVQQFEAFGSEEKPLPWANTDKQTWRVDSSLAGGRVTIRYRVYANTLTGSFAQFDSSHANINGAGVYMYVAGHKPDAIRLSVETPPSWGSAARIYSGFSLSTSQKTFHAPNYDLLIDTPMEVSTQDTSREFKEDGKVFRVVAHSLGQGDEAPARWTKDLTRGLKKIVHSEMEMMPAPDFDNYTFLVHVSPFINEGDGMEHLNSTEIIVKGVADENTLEEAELDAAHEFFHLWNVKRLRPAALGPFDYTKEDYTRSLWFAEGLTQYYSYVNLRRAGIWTRQDFLDHLAGEIRTLQEEPGREMMSAESSSFHAWFYDRAPQMQQTNFVNSTISYYNKGALLGMLLDLEIRERTGGKKSLDDLMRYMYNKFYNAPAATYYLRGRGYTEADILDALDKVSGTDCSAFFNRYIRGTDELPYDKVLAGVGMRLSTALDPGAGPSLGILGEQVANGLRIMAVRPGQAADLAGLSRGDVLVSVDQLSLVTGSLTDRLKLYPPGAVVPFAVDRLGKRLTIQVKLGPPVPRDYTLEEVSGATREQSQIRNGWLGQ
ncbi:MAG: M61 family metallopeptidase [Acidobacteriota bacterium]|nr:M61 family metallopeptidase [Acidobacteriota bacterium]